MREKHCRPDMRITPACAGKRRCKIWFPCSSEDHPCVCREKSPSTCSELARTGSPLRVQGKVKFIIIMRYLHRITPACAGKSQSDSQDCYRLQDHPCVCREKLQKKVTLLLSTGSPLRVQGKEAHVQAL